MPNLENQGVLHFECQCQKLLNLCHNTYILLFFIDLSTNRIGVYGLIEHRYFKIKILLTFSYLQEVITSKLII